MQQSPETIWPDGPQNPLQVHCGGQLRDELSKIKPKLELGKLLSGRGGEKPGQYLKFRFQILPAADRAVVQGCGIQIDDG